MNGTKFEELKLENQLCFPLYAASRQIIKKYKPFLDELNLTYTQYIAMMLLWEKRSMTVKEIGEDLFLDSGTLTPLLKKLEAKGLLTRRRSAADERILHIDLTPTGEMLREKAIHIPEQMAQCVALTQEDAARLRCILHKLLAKTEEPQ